jgi:hypothetical protein
VRSPLFIFFNAALFFLAGIGFSAAERRLGAQSPFPDHLLCEANPDRLELEASSGKGGWTYAADGPVLDAQSQPSGDWLITGGRGKVFLLHHTMGKKPWVSSWDWSNLAVDPPVSAVAVDWDLNGNPTLVLAADAVKKRIFLADAKSEQAKIRWEFPLPEAPRSVRVCPDSGNFLVTLPSQVEEVDFKQAKVIWDLALPGASDAARSPDSNSYVIDGQGQVFAYDVDQTLLWKTALDPQADQWKNLSLSLFNTPASENIRVLVSGTSRTRQGRKSRIWILDSKNGKILTGEDVPGGALTRAVPRIEGMEPGPR